MALSDPERTKTRLDQWLWFARFVKTRSLGARLCATGIVAVNGVPAKKANHAVRIGDLVVVPLAGWRRTVRVVALGVRRGPAVEARALYEEAAPALRLAGISAEWAPLLDEGDWSESAPDLGAGLGTHSPSPR